MPDLSAFLEERLEELTTKHQIDPFSREFLFGSDELCTRLRNQPTILGPNGQVTLLSAMLRYALDDAKRANLFFSPYHLGSLKQIPQARLTIVDLAKKVRKEKHERTPAPKRTWADWNADPESLKKEFESITDALKGITGRTAGKYEDKQNTLRVIYLIDRMMADPSIAIEGRSKRFLTFIKTPTRFSFEARGAYPIAESEDNTFLLNDLKEYFGVEIDYEKKDKIDSVFYSLIDRISAIRAHLDEVAYSSGRLRIPDRYKSLRAAVDAIAGPSEPDPRRQSARLDEDLYLHLNRFEFLHFAGAHAEIIENAKPPSPIKPIQNEMIVALSALAAETRNYFHTTQYNFRLADFADIANASSGLFLDLLDASLGFRPSKSHYVRSISLAYELLYRTRVFGSGLPLSRESVKISFRNMVSALCATAQAVKFPTHYRPRVFGDDSQARSIITPLESPIKFDSNKPPREIPEGYLQIWHNRREWVQDALEGAYEIAELKFSLRTLLWTKFVECVQPNDIAAIEENLSRLETRLRGLSPTV
ncbi:hypothetical protein [Stenotrophomonas sp.]|uniref:hypothetical protein n=1 Tax=Stenotrophomonas sp. TaxID=69392 RepID=UPI002FC7FB98